MGKTLKARLVESSGEPKEVPGPVVGCRFIWRPDVYSLASTSPRSHANHSSPPLSSVFSCVHWSMRVKKTVVCQVDLLLLLALAGVLTLS